MDDANQSKGQGAGKAAPEKDNDREANLIWETSQEIGAELPDKLAAYFEHRHLTPPTPMPSCMRFASSLYHSTAKTNYPALVIRATDPLTMKPLGIQRTFLEPSGRGQAPVGKGWRKLSLGKMKGGVAYLAAPLPGQPLILAEGVENALSAMAASNLPGWSLFGVENFKGLTLPPDIRSVIVLGENDAANAKALAAFINRQRKRGVLVSIARTPPGYNDLNQVLMEPRDRTPEESIALVREAVERAQGRGPGGGLGPSVGAGPSAGSGPGAGVSGPGAAPNFSASDPAEEREYLVFGGSVWRTKDIGWAWVSQDFEVLGLARDPAKNDWSKYIRFINADGEPRETIVAEALLHGEPKAVVSMLGGLGMRISHTSSGHNDFISYLGAIEVVDRITIALRTGWVQVRDKLAFALPNVISTNLAEKVVLTDGLGGAYEQAGTLAEWQAHIAVPADQHLALRLAIALSLAGPLLYLGGHEGGIFHLYGPSSQGKTTLLKITASAWGSGADGCYVRTWRATSNGLEATLAASCDTVLPLDEIGQADSREVGNVAYMVTGSIGKMRMRRDASLKPSHRWRVLALSSGETPFSTRYGPSGGKAGQFVRALDVSIESEAGVFDKPVPTPDAPTFDARKFADQMRAAASTYYGTAGPEFVRLLLENNVDRAALRARVSAITAEFSPPGGHGQTLRVAERFGLVAAAGELAIEFGLLPWPAGQPTKDMNAIYFSWLSARGTVEALEPEQMVAQVRAFIEAHGDSRFDDLDPPKHTLLTADEIVRRPVHNRVGFREGTGEARRWHVLPEAWKMEICAGLDPKKVAAELAKRGMLEGDAKRGNTRQQRAEGVNKNVYTLNPKIFQGGE